MEPLRSQVRGCLFVSVSKPYGVETIRPECELSRGFAELLKQKTLTAGDVELIKRLGFEVVQERRNL